MTRTSGWPSSSPAVRGCWADQGGAVLGPTLRCFLRCGSRPASSVWPGKHRPQSSVIVMVKVTTDAAPVGWLRYTMR